MNQKIREIDVETNHKINGMATITSQKTVKEELMKFMNDAAKKNEEKISKMTE